MAPSNYVLPSGAGMLLYTCVDPVCGTTVIQVSEECTDYDMTRLMEIMEGEDNCF